VFFRFHRGSEKQKTGLSGLPSNVLRQVSSTG
jgi:hypothetical protein